MQVSKVCALLLALRRPTDTLCLRERDHYRYNHAFLRCYTTLVVRKMRMLSVEGLKRQNVDHSRQLCREKRIRRT